MVDNRLPYCCRRALATLAVLLAIGVLHGAVLAETTPDADTDHPAVGKHPTTLDATRFFTTRKSTVQLPLPAEDNSFSFVVFGDRTGGSNVGLRVLERAVNDVNLIEPDLVMMTGDMVPGYCDGNAWLAQMRQFRSIMDRLHCPWFPTPGNHDVYGRGGNHDAEYESHFGPLWYAFEHKDCWFIVLYSDEGDPSTGQKGFARPELQKMSAEQYAWLQKALDKAKDARHVFVFLHHPRWFGEKARWLGEKSEGSYGDDWNRVHKLLAGHGNVSVVFCGHWHQMRHDGTRDGIEYLMTGSVGGLQYGFSADGGWLDEFHIVTVRGDRVAFGAVPVGQVMDVRRITGNISDQVARLGRQQPCFLATPAFNVLKPAAVNKVSVSMANPTDRPVEFVVQVDGKDHRWLSEPGQRQLTLEPNTEGAFDFDLHRLQRAGAQDDAVPGSLELVINANYLAEGWAVRMNERRVAVPMNLSVPDAAAAAAPDGMMDFDGKQDFVEVPSVGLPLPDGPLTLEAWFKPRSFSGRMALASKNHNSEYGLWVSNGRPHFGLFLGGGYVRVESDEPMLSANHWYHLAGVYDGSEVRLYLDGKLVSHAVGSGSRRTNGLSFFIAADPDRRNQGTALFDGMIDVVRLSKSAIYAGESFTPERTLKRRDDTLLLLNFDRVYGSIHPDDSGREAHGKSHGKAVIRPLTAN